MDIKLILKQLIKCNINSPLEQAHFLAQCEHESAGFKHLSESTNYRYKSAKLVLVNIRRKLKPNNARSKQLMIVFARSHGF